MEEKSFDIETIRELTSPIDNLEGTINYLNLEVNSYKNTINSFLKLYQSDDESITIIKNSMNTILKLQEELKNFAYENLNKFLKFQDLLIEKYKDSYIKRLKGIKSTPDSIKKLGLFLIENKNISSIIYKLSYTPSITVEQWLLIIDTLKTNTLFRSIGEKLKIYYEKIIQKRLEVELKDIPDNTEKELIELYKKSYFEKPISFHEFLIEYESSLPEKELERRKKLIEQRKELEKIEKLKKKQQEQQQSFQDYFKYSKEEFNRIMRKKKRKKLSEIASKPKTETRLSEEISEKIEKFKSRFSKKFEEDYLLKKEDDKSPLDLIRERREKKEKEYKEFLKKFKEK
ncbi:MAG: hypothetical protein ACP6IY_13940 [Promethearchaeia archaeon]